MPTTTEDATRLLREAEDDRAHARLVPGIAHDAASLLGVSLTAVSHAGETAAALAAELAAGTLTRSRTAAGLGTVEEAARLAVANLTRAAALLAGLKRFASDGAGDEPEAVELGPLLADLAAGLSPMARRASARIEVRVPAGLVVRTRSSALVRVLLNLVQNALVHAFPAGRPGTVVLAADVEGAGALVTVRDDGRGMTAGEAARAFEPYFTTRGGQGGTGLGLSLVRELVEGPLGGTVTLDTAPGAGAAFELRIPGL